MKSERKKRLEKEWRMRNKEHSRKYSNEYYHKNKDKCRAIQKKYLNSHKQQRNEYMKQYKKLNFKKYQHYGFVYRLRNRLSGTHTLGEWEILKAQHNWTCPSCKRQEPKIRLTKDHIIPLCKGGSSNIENIQPLCGNCNSQKYTREEKYANN